MEVIHQDLVVHTLRIRLFLHRPTTPPFDQNLGIALDDLADFQVRFRPNQHRIDASGHSLSPAEWKRSSRIGISFYRALRSIGTTMVEKN